MPGIIDQVLLSPRNIDFYFYGRGAGGEFLSSLAAIANRKNHKIMPAPEYQGKKRVATIDGNKVESIVFLSARYFKHPEPVSNGIEDIGYNLYKVGSWFPDPVERITYTKMVLFHYLQSFLFLRKEYDIKKPIIDQISFYNDVSITLCTHWIPYPHENDLAFTYFRENFEKRTLGIPKFEEQPYWDVINIDPQSKQGRNFVANWCVKTGLSKTGSKEPIKKMMEHRAFENIKLKFPFMDYMIEKDYDSIKYWLEDRYGSDLDFDFIDQSLVNYRKIRIEPWL